MAPEVLCSAMLIQFRLSLTHLPKPLPSVPPHRSQSPPVRSLCSATLLQFLLDYPLGPKRLAQHLAFLAANLSYEHETGRLAVLETLQLVRDL